MRARLEPVPGQLVTQEHTRAVYIPDDLRDLAGPTSGTVTLPIHIDWSAANTYDLSDPRRLLTLYATVLSEATSESDICTYLDRKTLTRLWPALNLPRRVRVTWESAHPELAWR